MKRNHINYPDDSGRVYCKKQNNVRKINWDTCSKCDYFNGSYQGNGVECVYEDTQDRYSSNPYEKYQRNNLELQE